MANGSVDVLERLESVRFVICAHWLNLNAISILHFYIPEAVEVLNNALSNCWYILSENTTMFFLL